MHVLEGAEAVRMVLDGECCRTPEGFHAGTVDRVLYVPFRQACDAAEAIILCRNQGLIKSKLDVMGPEMAACVYALTLAAPILPC